MREKRLRLLRSQLRSRLRRHSPIKKAHPYPMWATMAYTRSYTSLGADSRINCSRRRTTVEEGGGGGRWGDGRRRLEFAFRFGRTTIAARSSRPAGPAPTEPVTCRTAAAGRRDATRRLCFRFPLSFLRAFGRRRGDSTCGAPLLALGIAVGVGTYAARREG